VQTHHGVQGKVVEPPTHCLQSWHRGVGYLKTVLLAFCQAVDRHATQPEMSSCVRGCHIGRLFF
jgi:hypothetical protein